MTFRVPEKYRLTRGAMGTDARFGNNGVFQFAAAPGRAFLNVIASDEIGWEHVSVSNPARCPTWEEMCWIKAQFWGPDDCVVQYHPPASEYVNDHPYCLHLWRPTEGALPMPPSWMVGTKIKEASDAD
jgi:hypothetical protein